MATDPMPKNAAAEASTAEPYAYARKNGVLTCVRCGHYSSARVCDRCNAPAAAAEPIPMVLHCPKCGTQHVDAPEPEKGWTNPPHKSHLCHACGTIWRPADVPTNGVAAIATRGSDDNFDGEPATVAELRAEMERLRLTVKSIATMLGWRNVPPRESLEANLRAIRSRLEKAEAEVARKDDAALRDALYVGEIRFRTCVLSSTVHDKILAALAPAAPPESARTDPALGECVGHLGPPSNTGEPHPQGGTCSFWRPIPAPAPAVAAPVAPSGAESAAPRDSADEPLRVLGVGLSSSPDQSALLLTCGACGGTTTMLLDGEGADRLRAALATDKPETPA